MKPLYVFFLLVLFPFGISGQQHDIENIILGSPLDYKEKNAKVNSNLDYYNAIKNFNQKSKRGRLKSNEFQYQLDSTYNLVGGFPLGRTEYIYQDTVEIIPYWSKDVYTSAFEGQSYSRFTYKNNLLETQSYHEWNGDRNMLNGDNPSLLRKYLYDANLNLIEVQAQSSDDIINKELWDYDQFIYNEKKLLDSSLFYRKSFFSDTTILRSTEKFLYDEEKNLVCIKKEFYDLINTNELVSRDSIIFKYNNDGLITEEVKYAENSEDPTANFRITRHTKYYYDEENKLFKIYIARGTNNNFENFDVEQYTYHPYGSLKERRLFRAEIQNFDTIYYSLSSVKNRSVYNHDETISHELVRYPKSKIDHDFEDHMIINRKEFSGGDNLEPEVLNFNFQYFYSEIDPVDTHSINISEEEKVRIFPNPTSKIINISFKDMIKGEIQLLDLHGKIYKSLNIDSTSHMLDTSQLPSSTYFLRIQDEFGKQIHIEKIIITR